MTDFFYIITLSWLNAAGIDDSVTHTSVVTLRPGETTQDLATRIYDETTLAVQLGKTIPAGHGMVIRYFMLLPNDPARI